MKVKVFNSFSIGTNHLGRAVFAARSFKPREVLTQFTGEILNRKNIPSVYEGSDDRFVQIGVHKFMGASNDIDDYINHSCDPNTGLKFTNYGVILVALKPIETGDEITWDYSTTMYKHDWVMNCRCESSSCRQQVGEFFTLPKSRQKYYIEQGIVPPYILRAYKKKMSKSTPLSKKKKLVRAPRVKLA